MAAVCIWYKEEQKGNKTGMNQDRVYENRRNSYQGNPMDRMDYRGSMMYDEFPDRLMMEHTCRNIARQYSRENGGKDEKTAEEELLDLIGVLFYNEMFRRRSRRKHYYNLWL